MPIRQLWLFAFAPALALAQQPVTVQVDLSARQGPMKHIWSYFGYDEPNYTYMKYGTKLLGELSDLGPSPVYVRTHHLFCTGDGTAALKWGSTNAYTEGAAGNPVFSWTILDRIFDAYAKAKVRPFVELGFMPEALSVHPRPYAVKFRQEGSGTGWSYPPKDYNKWAGLVTGFVRHAVERYGAAAAESWYWELWNEPDIFYWRGTPEEYDKLYDYTAAAVKRALPGARVGGPATTGPGNPKAAAFLRQFLEHCARTGAPLDFISFHAKGAPTTAGGHVVMGLAKNLVDVNNGYEIVASFPQYKNLPIVLSESDPEGCAACSARTDPQNGYRNGTLYPAYTAAAMKGILDLALRHKVNIEGMLTWAFEFEDQPYFDGLRTLATNGIDKPVLNVFRMAGRMSGDRVRLVSGGAADLQAILRAGVRGQPDIDGLAARGERQAAVMVWNYHDEDVAGPAEPVRLAISGIPAVAGRVMVRHYRIDEEHSNAHTAWQQMGSPQSPSARQYADLERSGRLEYLEQPRRMTPENGAVELTFPLPRHAVSLIEVLW
jgi:xylan 1,4-beta-xylosidase